MKQENNRTLIFEPCLSGHHLEYLHHYYMGALNRPHETYIFYVPNSFKVLKDNFIWESAANIEFRYFSNKDLLYAEKGSFLMKKVRSSILLRKKIIETNSDKVLLTVLMVMLPVMLLFIPSRVKIRGIVYQIYLYNIGKVSRFRILLDRIVYWLLSVSRCIERVFILNDEDSAKELNKIYGTDKFHFIPDPVPLINFSKVENVRLKFDIRQNEIVYLHFGGLTERKGTLDILKAIKVMDSMNLQDKCFIFAGKIHKNIKESFYALLEDCNEKAHIIVIDEFCSYEMLHNLCYSSDIILMPYKITTLSSGVLGYASVFKKPVIGPEQNLLGRIIKNYNLGLVIPKINTDNLTRAIMKNLYYTANNHSEVNSLDAFIKKIFLV